MTCETVSAEPVSAAPVAASIGLAHLKRLRGYYRSAGWPMRDNLELDLLVAGLAELRTGPGGHETVHVTTAGLHALAGLLARNRASLARHEALVARVVDHLQAQGWLTFTGRSFKVKPQDKWISVRPDVFALPQTLDERRIVPCVYEIKVSRADLKSDLRNDAKRLGYEFLSKRLYYVLPEGLATDADLAAIPDSCGVLLAASGRLIEQRPAPMRDVDLRPIHWLQLLASCSDAKIGEPLQLPLQNADADRNAHG